MKISDEEFKQILADYRVYEDECHALISLPWRYDVSFWNGVTVDRVENSKTQAMRFSTEIAASMPQVLSFLCENKEIIPEMPETKRGGVICRYFSFPNNEARKNAFALMDGAAYNQNNQYVIYQVIQSPSGLIKGRDVLCLRQVIEISESYHYQVWVNSVLRNHRRVEQLEREFFTGVIDAQVVDGVVRVTACCEVSPTSTASSGLVFLKLKGLGSFVAELYEKYK